MTTSWQELTPDQKREAVRGLLAEGKTYSGAAELLGCSRTAIAGVVERSIRTSNPIAAAHKPGGTGRVRKAAAPKPKAKAKNATQIVQEKARRARADSRKPKPPSFGTIAGVLDTPPDARPLYDRAWDVLEGSTPVNIEDHTTGCRWPVVRPDRDFSAFCNEPAEGAHVYCARHRTLGTRPEPERVKRKVAGKIKAFNL